MEHKNSRNKYLDSEIEEANARCDKYQVAVAFVSVFITVAKYIFSDRSRVDIKILCLGLALIGVIYLGRFDYLKEKYKKRDRLLNDEMPNFILELMLLIDGGMLPENAIRQIAGENKTFKEEKYKFEKPLEYGLNYVISNAETSGSEIVHELYEFARSAGSRDLMRIASLVYESKKRGNDLGSKLDRERRAILQKKTNSANSAASLAETKLCFPLMLLLISILIISAAPAMLVM